MILCQLTRNHQLHFNKLFILLIFRAWASHIWNSSLLTARSARGRIWFLWFFWWRFEASFWFLIPVSDRLFRGKFFDLWFLFSFVSWSCFLSFFQLHDFRRHLWFCTSEIRMVDNLRCDRSMASLQLNQRLFFDFLFFFLGFFGHRDRLAYWLFFNRLNFNFLIAFILIYFGYRL